MAMANSNGTCTLPYPDRFHAAVAFVSKQPQDKLHEESKLLLYALQQQATVGPCNEPRPWGWNVVSNAKWQSWKQLGDLAAVEAMRLFVRTLEEDVADWWTPEFADSWQAPAGEASAAAAAAKPAPHAAPPAAGPSSARSAGSGATTPPRRALESAPSGVNPATPAKSRSVAEVVVEGSWVSPFIASDRRPPPRYEHSMALVGNHLYVVGGSCGGRYLSDAWALNLENLTWTRLVSAGTKSAAAAGGSEEAGEGATLLSPALLPVAGHTAVGWNGNVLCVGGHSKAQDSVPHMPVRLLDVSTGSWSALTTSPASGGSGGVPRARGGHTATLVGPKVYVFGGEDHRRKPCNELWTLDLATLEWDKPQTTGTPPAPRSAHIAVPFRNRYVLVFAGGSVASCYNDLFVLDTQTLEWSSPAAEGPVPPQRAGHAAAVLGSTLYVVGGGNNSSGCADMYSLDMTNLGSGPLVWTLVGNTPPDAAIASEGLSLLPVPMAGCMVSFGGYNGRYHNAVHVYRPENYALAVKQASAALASPNAPSATATKGRSSPSQVTPPRGALTPAADRAAPGTSASSAATPAPGPTAAELEAVKREAAAVKEAVAHEVSIMRRQLDSSTAALSEAERNVEGAREALGAEQQRAMQLEVELAELRQRLSTMGELEKEVARFRQRAAEEAQRKSSIWTYITGEPPAQ